MIKCRKCGTTLPVGTGELHHVIPKFIGGTDKDGRIYLCEKHHNILHNIIPSIIWNYVSEVNKNICRKAIKAYTEKWLTR